jgi:glyoxylase-like metal-dependent hydrolase (beta-lactamase superfamily II)
MNPRAFALAAALCLTAPLAFAAPPPSPPPSPPVTEAQRPYLQQVMRLDQRVHLLLQRPSSLPAAIGNVTVIEQADGLVLIDSGGSIGSGRRVVALVRSISPKPVKAVIITHWHPDHTMGLPAILEAWPRAEIIASAQTRDHMLGDDQKTIPKHPDPAYDQARVAQLEGYKTQDFGLDLTRPAVQRGMAATIAFLDLRKLDAPGGYIVAPTRTFTDRLDLPDARAPIEVRLLGRGDTDGDAVVWLPKQRILSAGDNVALPVPYGFTGFQSDWIGLLKTLKSYPFRVLVPGHGEPQRDAAAIDRLIAMIERVRAEVPPLVAQGLTADQIKARLDFSAERNAFVGDDAWLGAWFDNYTRDAMIDAAYTAAGGKPA